MEEKNFFFNRILGVITTIFLIELGAFLFKQNGFNKGFTGLTIKDIVSNASSQTLLLSKIFLIVQWGALIILLIFVFAKDRIKKIEKNEISITEFNQIRKKKGTDIDILYSILQEKKHMRISTISKLFKINKDTAMGWCKTLESGELASIEYPRIGEVIVKIIEK